MAATGEVDLSTAPRLGPQLFTLLQGHDLVIIEVDLAGVRFLDCAGVGVFLPVRDAATDSPFILVQAESQHRGHAVIEQINADLVNGPLAHIPSGDLHANSAWLACATITHNLTRAARCLAGAGYAKARGATIRTHISHVAARLAHRACTIHLRLPQHWPWHHAFDNLLAAVHAQPV